MPSGSYAGSRASSRGPPSSSAAPSTSRAPSQASGPSALKVPPPPEPGSGAGSGASSPGASPGAAAATGGTSAPSSEAPSFVSPSARTKDVVDSYLRELYGGSAPTRLLAAQGLGALPSFLRPTERPGALRMAVELGVVGSLADVLVADDEQEVQEACLVALSSLLLTTAPHEQHGAPPGLRPPHLRQLGPSLLRPEVLDMMGHLLSVTSSPRVVLAAARVTAIMAPHLTQASDVHVIESRLIPAMLSAVAASPPPDQPPGPASGAAGAAAIATPRDSAACALSLLALAEATPDLYVTICTADFFQALAVLYGRCVDPAQPSNAVLPGDAAALLLRALGLCPPPHWAARLPKGHVRAMERHLEESDALECLVSCVAVEAANLRTFGEGLAQAVAESARAVVAKNGLELEQLQSRAKEVQRRQAEARDTTAEARRQAEAAAADASDAAAAAEAADAEVRAARNGGTAEQRRRRREAEAAAAQLAAAAVERRRGVEEAEAAEAGLREEVVTLRRAVAPLRWQSERLAKMEAAAQAWMDAYGSPTPGRSKVKLSKPHIGLLQQLLSFLAAQVAPPPPQRPERPSGPRVGVYPPPPPLPGPSPEHVAAVHSKLLSGGLVQAVVRLYSVVSALRSLAGELASLAADLELVPDMAGALEGAAGAMAREEAALGDVHKRAAARMAQVNVEVGKLRKALRLGTPQQGSSGGGASHRAAVELGPGNGMSRGVRREDVAERLQALEAEGLELGAVVGDLEALREVLKDRMEAVSAASSALADAHASFLVAFPSQAAPVTPTRAPAAPAATRASPRSPATSPRGGKPSPRSRSGPASSPRPLSLLPKDPSHPAGQLASTMLQSLDAVVTHGSSNMAALLRQIHGKLPAPSPDAAAGAQMASPGSTASLGSSGVGGAGSPRGASKAQPSVSGSAAAGSRAARPSSAPARSRGTAYGGLGALHGSGPFPTDGHGRPLRFPAESMYGMIQATHSPLRGYSAPNNGPRLALLRLREKAAARGRLHAAAGSAASFATSPPLSASPSDSALASSLGSLAVAEESRRLVDQAVSSVLFDPVPDLHPERPADGVGAKAPGSGGNGGGGGGGGGGSSRTSRSGAPSVQGQPRAEASVAAGGGAAADGAGASVLDALLAQSERLCGVLDRLASLQMFARSTCRTCRRLPSGLSYSTLEPGQLGPYTAQLHAMWAEALTHHADLRVPVAESVTEMAQLGLVPSSDFEAVYRASGMLDGLMRMLAGQMRPGGKDTKADPKAADADGAASSSSASVSSSTSTSTSPARKPRHVGRLTATAPPTLRPGPAQQAEQAAAARALLALRTAQTDVLEALAQDDKLLRKLCTLSLDHSLSWPARSAACDTLADLVLGGGPAAEAAVRAGAYAALAEAINRDSYPYMNQDPSAGKASVVSALAALAAHPELLEGVVAAAQAPGGPSSGLPLSSPEQVQSAILRSLWSVCAQVHATYSSDRTGHGRHVDPALVSALLSTAATAAHELAVLADTSPEARRAMREELRLGGKISAAFLQAIKDPPLYEAIMELRKNLS